MPRDPREGVGPQPRVLGSFTGERRCLNCGDNEFLPGLDEYMCLRCGVKQLADGTPAVPDTLCLVPSEANKGARGMGAPNQRHSWDELMAQERGESLEAPASAGPPGATPKIGG